MAKILFSMERWLNADRHPSPHFYCTVGALKALPGAAHFSVQVAYDEIVALGKDPDEEVVRQVAALEPDLVFATAQLHFADSNVSPACYGYIRDELKIPVVMMWTESAPDVVQFADRYAPYVTANVFVDTAAHWQRFTKHAARTVWLPEPKDPTIFFADERERDIPISFVGNLLGRPDRALNIAYLWGQNIDVQKYGGMRDQQCLPTIESYAEILRRSVITLNFTSAVTFQHINARTSEALMCGAMLLESLSDETARILDMFVHYVPFNEIFHISEETGSVVIQDSGDLLDRVRYYTGKGANEARKIAAAGRGKGMELFDGKKFWKGVFELAGIKNGL